MQVILLTLVIILATSWLLEWQCRLAAEHKVRRLRRIVRAQEEILHDLLQCETIRSVRRKMEQGEPSLN